MAQQMKKIRIIFSIGLMAGIILAVFSPVLKNEFTNWDDNRYVTNNPVIREISLENLKTIFSSAILYNYHPITLLSYMAEYRFFKLNPVSYHLTNLFLHLANCLLVFWLILMLTGRIRVALFTILLFGLHPLQVEAVAWISERKGLLCAFFFLCSLISYLRYVQRGRSSKYYYYLTLILFIFSFLSKGAAVALPLALFLIEYFHGGRNKITLKDKIPFFISAFFFGAIAVYTQYAGGAIRKENLFNLWDKAAVAGYAGLFYIGKIFFPIRLSCAYPLSGVKDPSVFIYALIALIVTVVIFLRSKGFRRTIIFGWGFFLITLLPVLQFVPVGHTRVADRYVYLPLLGVTYFVAEGLIRIYQGARKKVIIRVLLSTFFVLTILALSLLSRTRCKVWNNSVVLWSDCISSYPQVLRAYVNRAEAYFAKGDFDRALSDCNKALEIDPRSVRAYNNRANIYLYKGQTEQALADYNKALEIDPRADYVYNNRAIIYFKKSEYNKSWLDVRKAQALGRVVSREFIEQLTRISNQ